MENPLDRAGEAADKIGEGVGGLLHGTARFLEDLTGNVTAAAIFAGFLLFALALVRGAAGARHHILYGQSIRVLGLIGLAGSVTVALVNAVIFDDVLINDIPDKQLIYKGLTGKEYSEGFDPSTFIQDFFDNVLWMQWYFLVFVIMIVVGTIVIRAIDAMGSRSRQDIFPD
ncbi:hypothetical protein [Jiella pacifica]|uniref:Uncharacterized protein n=1 Tax=Jiella pacifica TaxID=2696469 RepID=A0A6N9TB84_9HYPH|nr:hypothetical protein [Jiella pacifica]NDW07832.1 hypothetical protein [Jiella pacifica]